MLSALCALEFFYCIVVEELWAVHPTCCVLKLLSWRELVRIYFWCGNSLQFRLSIHFWQAGVLDTMLETFLFLKISFSFSFLTRMFGLSPFCFSDIFKYFQVSLETWRHTIETLNAHYSKAEEVCCGTVMETLLGCSSCYISRLFSKVASWYFFISFILF